jgi:hypothetical protein
MNTCSMHSACARGFPPRASRLDPSVVLGDE